MKLFFSLTSFMILHLISACSVIDIPVKAYDVAKEFVFPSGEKLRWEQVTMGVGREANKNSPIAVDIVLIFNEGLVTKVSELTSSDWFKSKNYILKTFPQDLAVKSWELAPGDSLQIPSSFFGTERVFSVMAFADYFSDGEHRVRIDHLRGGVILEFDINDFSAFSILRK